MRELVNGFGFGLALALDFRSLLLDSFHQPMLI